MLLLLLFGLADVPLARQTTPWNPTPHPLGKLNTVNTSVALAKQEIWLQNQLLLLLYRVGFLCFLDCSGLFSYFMSTKSSPPLIWVDFWRKLDPLSKEENGLDSSSQLIDTHTLLTWPWWIGCGLWGFMKVWSGQPLHTKPKMAHQFLDLTHSEEHWSTSAGWVVQKAKSMTKCMYVMVYWLKDKSESNSHIFADKEIELDKLQLVKLENFSLLLH